MRSVLAGSLIPAGSWKEALFNLGEVQDLQQKIAFDCYGDAQRRPFPVVVRDGGFALK